MTDTPKFPDNPNHANGTCEECGEPCQVYGCRWCPDCYDAGSARIREALRMPRVPKAQTVAEWTASFKPLGAPLAIETPAPWQQAALVALGVAPQACPSTLVGLPVTVDRGVPASTLFLLAARPGRTRAMFDALRLDLDDVDASPGPACLS